MVTGFVVYGCVGLSTGFPKNFGRENGSGFADFKSECAHRYLFTKTLKNLRPKPPHPLRWGGCKRLAPHGPLCMAATEAVLRSRVAAQSTPHTPARQRTQTQNKKKQIA